MYYLTPSIKDYAWGSKTLLAELAGAQATGQPQAEMWFGTHPTTPTLLDDGAELAELTNLPYLVKLIAAAQPLSIQAHPSPEHARTGFAAENAAGIPLDDPKRTYRDANHKPEILVALTEFTAMAGFRDPRESAKTFTLLAALVEDTAMAEVLNINAIQLAEGQLKLVFEQLVDPRGPFRETDGWTSVIFNAVSDRSTSDRHLLNARSLAAIHPDDP